MLLPQGFHVQAVRLVGGAVGVGVEMETREAFNGRGGGIHPADVGETALPQQSRQGNFVIHPQVRLPTQAKLPDPVRVRRRRGILAPLQAVRAFRYSAPTRWMIKSSAGTSGRAQSRSISPPLWWRQSWSISSTIIHTCRAAASWSSGLRRAAFSCSR